MGGAERRAIIEVGAAIPLAVPAIVLERGFERADMQAPGFSALGFAARIGNLGELPENRVQEPAQPDTLALAVLSHPVHAVVPVSGADQRKAVATDTEASVQGPGAMFKEAGARRRYPRLKIGFEVSRGKMFAFQKGYGLIEHTGFSRDFEEVDYGVRQPQQIVGNAGANAASRRRMPPVLDVALDELARSSTQ